MKETKRDGFVLDEDIALTHAPQHTFERRQEGRQYHASDEPIQNNRKIVLIRGQIYKKIRFVFKITLRCVLSLSYDVDLRPAKIFVEIFLSQFTKAICLSGESILRDSLALICITLLIYVILD